VYADTDLWVALIKGDDWLSEHAERLIEEYEGELEVSLATFIELLLIEEKFDVSAERAFRGVLALAEYDGSKRVLFQALEYYDRGLTPFDAFHVALAGESIISSDKAFDPLIERVPLEPNDDRE
jgi:predicted nucleic acid-binding protein